MNLPSKSQIRESFKNQRKLLSADFRFSEGQRIFERLRRFLSLENRRYRWLLYSPIQGEVPTQFILDWALERKEEVFFPKLNGETLEFHEAKKFSEMSPGKFSLEPAATAKKLEGIAEDCLVVIPGVAFSRLGDRIGFGKGYYDRFLSQHPRAQRLGLAYSFQISDRVWPTEPYDQKLDLVFTPSALWGSVFRNYVGS